MRSIPSGKRQFGSGDGNFSLSRSGISSLVGSLAVAISVAMYGQSFISGTLGSAAYAATEFAAFSDGSGEQVINCEPGSAHQPEIAAEPEPACESEPEKTTIEEKPNVRAIRPYATKAIEHFNRGAELQKSGHVKQAIAQYSAAIEADDRMEEAYSNLGMIYFQQKNYGNAIAAFYTALVLKPDRPKTLNALGAVLSESGRVKEAKEIWKRTIAADPNFASAYYNLGTLLENEKDYQGARNAYFTALELNSTLSDARSRMAKLPKGKNEIVQAISLLPKTEAPSQEVGTGAVRQQPAVEESNCQIAESNQFEQSGSSSIELVTYSQVGDTVPPLMGQPDYVQTLSAPGVQFSSTGDDARQMVLQPSQTKQSSRSSTQSIEFSSGGGVGFDSKQLVAMKSQSATKPTAKPTSAHTPTTSAASRVMKPVIAMRQPLKAQVPTTAKPAIVASEPELRMFVQLPQSQ